MPATPPFSDKPSNEETDDAGRTFEWLPDPKRYWYYGGTVQDRLFGNLGFHVFAAVFYLFMTVGVPWLAMNKNNNDPTAAAEWLFGLEFCLFGKPLIGMLWVGIVTLGLPLFIWCERLTFDDWLSHQPQNRKEKLKARFDLNTSNMEVFWKAVAGLYVAAGLFTFSHKTEKIGKGQASTPQEATEAVKKALDEMMHVMDEQQKRKLEAVQAKLEGLEKALGKRQ